MKLPLDLKIYAVYLVLTTLGWLVVGYARTVAPFGLFVVTGVGAHIHSVVLQIMTILSAILIISKLPAGWHLAFWSAFYDLIYFLIGGLTGSLRTAMVISGGGRVFPNKSYHIILSMTVIVCLAQVAYLLWRRKRFFAVCRAAKSERSL